MLLAWPVLSLLAAVLVGSPPGPSRPAYGRLEVPGPGDRGSRGDPPSPVARAWTRLLRLLAGSNVAIDHGTWSIGAPAPLVPAVRAAARRAVAETAAQDGIQAVDTVEVETSPGAIGTGWSLTLVSREGYGKTGKFVKGWKNYDCDALDKVIDQNLAIMWKQGIFTAERALSEKEVNEMKAHRAKKKCPGWRL